MLSARRTALVGTAGTFALIAFGLALLAFWPLPDPPPRAFDGEAAGPAQRMRVYWVGHSLLEARDSRVDAPENVLERVAALAEAADLDYGSFDHTLFGAPLSLLWRGEALSHPRQAPELLDRRRELERRGGEYDALVMTDTVPIGRSIRADASPYFAQRFHCAFAAQSPRGRTYLYETWTHLQASDGDAGYPAPSTWDWPARLSADRSLWEGVADLAATGRVPPPTPLGRLRQRLGLGEDGCGVDRPVFLVPVATALGRLAESIERRPIPHAGRELTLEDLFDNPYLEWPDDWPRREADPEEASRLEALAPRHPDAPLDDIHPSDIGVYFTSLVHFATLYRRSPIGLPPRAEGLSPETALALQTLVWEVVREDARAGVRAD